MPIEMDDDNEFTPEEVALMEQDTPLPQNIENDEDDTPASKDPASIPAVELAPEPAENKTPETKAEPKELTQNEPVENNPPQENNDGQKNEGYEAFMAKHKDKSPEQLAELAYNMAASRTQARDTAKQANERLQVVANQIKQNREARKADKERKINEYNELLQTDPDEAARVLHQQGVDEEDRLATENENREYRSQQMEVAKQYIPNFDQSAPQMWEFGVKTLGYSPQELHDVSDHRDLVMLDCAHRFHQLCLAGIVDRTGAYLGPPRQQQAQAQAQTQTQAQTQQPNHIERVANAQAKAGNSLGGVPNRAGAGRSLKTQAEDILAMDDDDFNNMSDKDVDKILRALDNTQ